MAPIMAAVVLNMFLLKEDGFDDAKIKERLKMFHTILKSTIEKL